MWGQLAGRISKIGDVVAPALSNDEDDEDEDEDYEDEGEEDEEDEGEYEDEEEEEEEEETGAPARGFVGFLTRALDGAKHSSTTPSKSQQQDSIQTSMLQQQQQQQQQQQKQVEEQEEEGDEEEEDVIDLDQLPSIQGSLFPTQNQQQQQSTHHQQQQSSALSSLSNSDDDMVLVPAANEVLASMVASTASVTPASNNPEPTSAFDNKKKSLDQPPSVPNTEPKPQIQLRVPDSSRLSTAVSPSLSSHTAAHHPKLSVTRVTQPQPSKPLSAKRLVVPSTQILPKQSSVAASNQSSRLKTPSVDQPASASSNSAPKESAKVQTIAPSTVATATTSDSIKPKEALTQPIEVTSNITNDVKQEQLEISKDQSSDSVTAKQESDADVTSNTVIPEKTLSSKQETKEATDEKVASDVNPTDSKGQPSSNVDLADDGKTSVVPALIKTPPPVEASAAVSNGISPQPIQSILPSVEKLNEQASSVVEADKSSDVASSTVPSPLTKSEKESAKQDVQLQQSPLQKSAATTINNGDGPSDELARWQAHCQELESQLQEVQDKLLQSERLVWEKEQQSEQQRQELMMKFQEKEIRLLEASNEDHQQEMEQMRQDAELLCQSLQQQMEQERKMALQQQQQLSRLLTEAEARVENAEESKKSAISKVQAELAQVQQRQKRSIQMAEDKLAQAMAKLDERDEEIRKLKTTVSTLQSKMTQHQEGAQEAEEEMDELHSENETLRQHVQVLQEECTTLRTHVDELEADAEKYSGLETELKKMKDAYERERALTQSAAQNLESNHAQAEYERDAALAEMKNLQQQLAAALADVNVSRSDTERIMMANANLQNALEAFQSEREAEMALLEEQRRAAEEATAAAHAAALDAMRESNDAKMKEVSIAADKAIRNIMEEVNQLERRVEGYRKENVQLRRSLDEAIHQLQMNQEDVIDRTLMKNVLLEWFTMKGRKEKRQVLEMMASLLHFTEDEKEKIHIIAGTGALSKVVGAVAAPLPPAATDHLDGNTVSEKWVNFLLAETDDGDANNAR